MFMKNSLLSLAVGTLFVLPMTLRADEQQPQPQPKAQEAARFNSFEEYLLSKNNVIKLTDEQAKAIIDSYKEYRQVQRGERKNFSKAEGFKQHMNKQNWQGKMQRSEMPGNWKERKVKDNENEENFPRHRRMEKMCGQGFEGKGDSENAQGRKAFCGNKERRRMNADKPQQGFTRCRGGDNKCPAENKPEVMKTKGKDGKSGFEGKSEGKEMMFLKKLIYQCIDEYMQNQGGKSEFKGRSEKTQYPRQMSRRGNHHGYMAERSEGGSDNYRRPRRMEDSRQECEFGMKCPDCGRVHKSRNFSGRDEEREDGQGWQGRGGYGRGRYFGHRGGYERRAEGDEEYAPRFHKRMPRFEQENDD